MKKTKKKSKVALIIGFILSLLGVGAAATIYISFSDISGISGNTVTIQSNKIQDVSGDVSVYHSVN